MAESSEQQDEVRADWAESDLHVAFALAIRVRRARRGLSQDALASGAGLHRNYVGAIERAEINPSLVTISRITRGLNVPLGDLLAETDGHLADPDALVHQRAKWLKRRRHRLTRRAAAVVSEQAARSGGDRSLSR
jgi:transcriptional regulator with XRE-family HTH domain